MISRADSAKFRFFFAMVGFRVSHIVVPALTMPACCCYGAMKNGIIIGAGRRPGVVQPAADAARPLSEADDPSGSSRVGLSAVVAIKGARLFLRHPRDTSRIARRRRAVVQPAGDIPDGGPRRRTQRKVVPASTTACGRADPLVVCPHTSVSSNSRPVHLILYTIFRARGTV